MSWMHQMPVAGYYWLKVEARRLDDDYVTIKLESGAVIEPVHWTLGDQFDPNYIWYSYYPNAGEGNDAPIVCPPNEVGDDPGVFVTVEGFLLLHTSLPAVKDVADQRSVKQLSTPKWPISLAG